MNPPLRLPGRRTPLEIYHSLREAGGIEDDPEQALVVAELDRLWHALQARGRPAWHRPWRRPASKPVQGIYLWGGVGRGKTWLMDLFLENLPAQRATRAHFHRFMARVHEALARHGSVRDPLALIAREWASGCDVLCFDEFFVSDIADAMLIGGLLKALLDEGIILVATSNVHPDELYRDGLQRARFLPAIDCIKQHCRVTEIAGDRDHRLRILEHTGVFQSSLEPDSDRLMEQRYDWFSGGKDLDRHFQVNGRDFEARRRGLGIVWFDFDELCRKARSAIDYIEIARGFNTVLFSAVPVLDDTSVDAVRRFIALVDEFYDRNVKLIISAAGPPQQLYTGQRLQFEFQRTWSRLTEMQSHDYLAKPHVP